MIVSMHLILLHHLLARKVFQIHHYLSNTFAVEQMYLLVLIRVGKTFENIKNALTHDKRLALRVSNQIVRSEPYPRQNSEKSYILSFRFDNFSISVTLTE